MIFEKHFPKTIYEDKIEIFEGGGGRNMRREKYLSGCSTHLFFITGFSLFRVLLILCLMRQVMLVLLILWPDFCIIILPLTPP
jgi:hypothetical protein